MILSKLKPAAGGADRPLDLSCVAADDRENKPSPLNLQAFRTRHLARRCGLAPAMARIVAGLCVRGGADDEPRRPALRQRCPRAPGSLVGMLGSTHDGEVLTPPEWPTALSGRPVWLGSTSSPPGLDAASRIRRRMPSARPTGRNSRRRSLTWRSPSAWESPSARACLAQWRGRPLSEKQAATLQTIWAERCGVDQ